VQQRNISVNGCEIQALSNSIALR